MEKKYFPIFIDLSEKNIVVIGGGVIASRRVQALLEFSEKVVVVAPELSESLQALHRQAKICWICDEYDKEQIKDADIVIAATNKACVNHQVKHDCQVTKKTTGHSILVSVADDKNLCDFYFPSIVQTEDVVVGINSGGSSPKQTKYVREQIEKLLNSGSIYE